MSDGDGRDGDGGGVYNVTCHLVLVVSVQLLLPSGIVSQLTFVLTPAPTNNSPRLRITLVT